MLGSVFLISLVLFVSAVAVQWALSSRVHGGQWLLNWLPPYALSYAFKTRSKYKPTSLFVIVSFFLFLVVSIAWCAALLISPATDDAQEHTRWSASIKGDALVLKSEGSLVSSVEWMIQHADFTDLDDHLSAGNNSHSFAEPKITHSYQDKASKHFKVDAIPASFVDITRESGNNISISFLVDDKEQRLNAMLAVRKIEKQKISKRSISEVLDPIWAKAPSSMSYRLGAIRDISNNERIVGVQFLDTHRIIKEMTLTFNMRQDKVNINHRSLLVLRQFISDLNRSRVGSSSDGLSSSGFASSTRPSSLTLDEFLKVEAQYADKTVVIIKKDSTRIEGRFFNIEKKRVLNLIQTLGAGSVEVKTPLRLIKEFTIQNITVDLTAKAEGAVPLTVGEVSIVETPSRVASSVERRVEPVLSKASSLTESTEINEGDTKVVNPYRALLGKKVYVLRKDGRSRKGILTQVNTTKSVKLRLLNGGLEIQIPQAEIQEMKISK